MYLIPDFPSPLASKINSSGDDDGDGDGDGAG